MLMSFAILLGCAAAGEALRAATGLPVPGTVIGIALLFGGLCLSGRKDGANPSMPAADGLLSYISLFFVPAGVGAGLRLAALGPYWPAIVFGILGSSILAIAITGRLVQVLLAWQDRRIVMPARTQPGPAE